MERHLVARLDAGKGSGVCSEGSGLNDSVYGKCQAPIRMFLEKRGEQFEQQSVLKDLASPCRPA